MKRKYRIVTTLNQYCYNSANDKMYTIQVYRDSILGYFGTWVDYNSYLDLDKAKEAMDHLLKPDIYTSI